MLATEIRVAAADCRFGQIEIRRGIYPVGGATIRFGATSTAFRFWLMGLAGTLPVMLIGGALLLWTRGEGCGELAEILSEIDPVRVTGDVTESVIRHRAELLVSRRLAGGFDLVNNATPIGFQVDQARVRQLGRPAEPAPRSPGPTRRRPLSTVPSMKTTKLLLLLLLALRLPEPD